MDAIGITRQRCWKYNWCLEFDIKGLFDNIDHLLLMKAVKKHTSNQWILLYIERWLKTPMQLPDGSLLEKTRGTMQGGVISPVLSNLFLHYVFDSWMSINRKDIPWCRYADDGLAHCKTELEAKQLLAELKARFEACSLELHPDKTKIIYCKDSNRRGEYSINQFDFLGYTFRQRVVKNDKLNKTFVSFSPAVSKNASKAMRAKIRAMNLRNRTDLELDNIAKIYNPIINGWLNYYGKYHFSEMNSVLRHFNKTLIAWIMRKYKSLRKSKTKAINLLMTIAKRRQNLFAHWQRGVIGAFA